MTEPLEDRVKRLEDWANRPDWLDQPAIFNGKPMVMGDTFPLAAKIFIGLCGLFCVGLLTLLIFAGVYHTITGQVFQL